MTLVSVSALKVANFGNGCFLNSTHEKQDEAFLGDFLAAHGPRGTRHF